MKRSIAILLSAALIFAVLLCGCGNSDAPSAAAGGSAATIPAENEIFELDKYDTFDFSYDVAEAFSKYVWEGDDSMIRDRGLTIDFDRSYISADDADYYYDYTDNGQGLLFCDIFDSHGMSHFAAEIAVTHDYGRTWNDLGAIRSTTGDFQPAITDNGSICIMKTSAVDGSTNFLLSENGGESFYDVNACDILSDVPASVLYCFDIEILTVGSKGQSIVCAWKANGNCYLIVEFNDMFRSHKILYSNYEFLEHDTEAAD